MARTGQALKSDPISESSFDSDIGVKTPISWVGRTGYPISGTRYRSFFYDVFYDVGSYIGVFYYDTEVTPISDFVPI